MSKPDPRQCAILLDIDGTLVDSTYHHALAWHRAFARYDVHPPVWTIHRTIGMGGDRLVTEVAGAEVEERLGDAVRDAWAEEYTAVVDQVQPLPGAAALVRELVEAGYVVALASSGKKHFSERAVRDLGVGEQIALLTTSDDAEESKPDPELLDATLDRLETDVSHAVLVGDTPYDVESAARLGLACIGVLTGGYARAELEDAGASMVVESLEELRDAVWADHLREPTAPR